MPTTATRFVVPLTDDEISTLETIWQESDTHRERTRALAILLSHRQFSIEQMAQICSVHRDTIGRWLDAWEQDRQEGLQDAPRSGAPRRFDPQEEERILELLNDYPNQPQTVISLIWEETGKPLTPDILSRLANERGYT